MTYLIEQEHSKEECLNELEGIQERDPQLLNSCYFACGTGQHQGFCFVEASSEDEVRKMLPSDFLSRAHIVQVEKYTPEQIRSFHQSGSGSTYGTQGSSQYGTQGGRRSGFEIETGREHGTRSGRDEESRGMGGSSR